MKRMIRVVALLFLGLLLPGCGHVKSARKLIRMAKRDHGNCEVISKSESDEKVVVVLKDELQGFEYTVSSSMQGIYIDGSSFGSLPSTTDGFEMALQSYAVTKAKDRIDELCARCGATYESFVLEVLIKITVPSSVSEKEARELCEACGKVLQEYNVNNRMDGYLVYIAHDPEWFKQNYGTYDINGNNKYPDSFYSSSGMSAACHIGSVRLPDCTFRDHEKEKDDYFTDQARMHNPDSEFVKKEVKTFADTGLPEYRFQSSGDQDFPQTVSDPVTFYYFRVPAGEYYICDFLDAESYTFYTTYDERTMSKRKKKSRLHITVNGK